MSQNFNKNNSLYQNADANSFYNSQNNTHSSDQSNFQNPDANSFHDVINNNAVNSNKIPQNIPQQPAQDQTLIQSPKNTSSLISSSTPSTLKNSTNNARQSFPTSGVTLMKSGNIKPSDNAAGQQKIRNNTGSQENLGLQKISNNTSSQRNSNNTGNIKDIQGTIKNVQGNMKDIPGPQKIPKNSSSLKISNTKSENVPTFIAQGLPVHSQSQLQKINQNYQQKQNQGSGKTLVHNSRLSSNINSKQLNKTQTGNTKNDPGPSLQNFRQSILTQFQSLNNRQVIDIILIYILKGFSMIFFYISQYYIYQLFVSQIVKAKASADPLPDLSIYIRNSIIGLIILQIIPLIIILTIISRNNYLSSYRQSTIIKIVCDVFLTNFILYLFGRTFVSIILSKSNNNYQDQPSYAIQELSSLLKSSFLCIAFLPYFSVFYLINSLNNQQSFSTK